MITQSHDHVTVIYTAVYLTQSHDHVTALNTTSYLYIYKFSSKYSLFYFWNEKILTEYFISLCSVIVHDQFEKILCLVYHDRVHVEYRYN